MRNFETDIVFLCAHRDCLTACKQKGVWRNQDEWELKQLEKDIPTVHKSIISINSKIWYLRKKRMEEAREFYNPMDDVDIIMLIRKDGSIHGIIL